MDYTPITTPDNPFNTDGLSQEVEAILGYLLLAKEAGLDVVATSTTDHPQFSSSGNVSRHVYPGTDGSGLAVDCRLRRRGNDIHRAVFDIFVPIEQSLRELIYAGAPYNIRAGKRVKPYAVADHRDHVHLAVGVGTFIRWPGVKRPEPALWRWEDYVPKPLEFTSAAVCPTGGYWKQTAEGGIYAVDGAPYIDAYNVHPDLGGSVRYFTALVSTSTGGYIQLANDGAFYRWDPK